jgi:HD-like signal output (HDOD) protein
MSDTLTTTMVGRNDRRERVRRTLRHLSRTGEVPTLPQTATAALAVARDPAASADELCGIIRTDVGLAARVLHVANSAAYARRAQARTLRDAVVALGLHKTCDILVAACFRQLSVASGPQAQALWHHALAVGLATEELARLTRSIEPGAGFLPGLFHDVGRVAFFVADATSTEVIQGLADAGAGKRTLLEREWYGFDHAEAGAILVEDWGLAPEQCDAIRCHHDPTRAEEGLTLAALLGAADRLAYAIGCGTGTAQPTEGEVHGLGLPPEDEARCAERVHLAFVRENDLFA